MKKQYIAPFTLALDFANRDNLLLTTSPGAGNQPGGSGGYDDAIGTESKEFDFRQSDFESPSFKETKF